MKYAIIENGVVINVAVADAPLEPNWIASDDASIGWLWDGAAFAPPPPQAPPTRTRADVLADLATLDTKSIRALCEQDADRLVALETQKVALRNELRTLS